MFPAGLKSGSSFAIRGEPQWIYGNVMGPSWSRGSLMGSITKMQPAAKPAKSTHCNNVHGKDMGQNGKIMGFVADRLARSGAGPLLHLRRCHRAARILGSHQRRAPASGPQAWLTLS